MSSISTIYGGHEILKLEKRGREPKDGELVERLPVRSSVRHQFPKFVYLNVLVPSSLLGHDILPDSILSTTVAVCVVVEGKK
jgi:hypothetical protein